MLLRLVRLECEVARSAQVHLSLDYAHKFAQLAVWCSVSQLFRFFFVLFLFFNMLCLLVVFVTVMLIVELKVLLLRLRECFCPLLPINIERDANPSCRKDAKTYFL